MFEDADLSTAALPLQREAEREGDSAYTQCIQSYTYNSPLFIHNIALFLCAKTLGRHSVFTHTRARCVYTISRFSCAQKPWADSSVDRIQTKNDVKTKLQTFALHLSPCCNRGGSKRRPSCLHLDHMSPIKTRRVETPFWFVIVT